MRTRIFFDLDETLVHVYLPTAADRDSIQFSYEFEGQVMSNWVFEIRKQAKDLIKKARDKVGHDNVFILTASVRSYATAINDAAEFMFNPSNILCREDMKQFKLGNNPDLVKELALTRNILIDNLEARDNKDKINFLQVKNGDYFSVNNYYAYDIEHDDFPDKVNLAIKNASKIK